LFSHIPDAKPASIFVVFTGFSADIFSDILQFLCTFVQRKSFFPHIPDEFASSIFLVFTMVPALFSSDILQILWKK
jgi:hypothetical protein